MQDLDIDDIFNQQLDAVDFTKEEPSHEETVHESVLIDFVNEVSTRHKYETELSSQEANIMSHLTVPGVSRYQMPRIPEKSTNIRKVNRSKLHAYTQMPVWDLNQALEITRFENLLEVYDFSNRIYKERLGKENLT